MKSGSILTWWSMLGMLAALREGNFVLACLWFFGILAAGEWFGWVAFKEFSVGRYKVFILLHPPFIGILPKEKLEPRVIYSFGEENQVLMAFGRFPIHVLKGKEVDE